ncbi:unnamed protein product [Polarella glacialis]|uniref:Uncharacterized protein n=1 Tax=Polarella glacialis TaxID=89957 RepID=A0A813ECI8_POLGL|nr:unnamed protein product [Polarella glacialis]
MVASSVFEPSPLPWAAFSLPGPEMLFGASCSSAGQGRATRPCAAGMPSAGPRQSVVAWALYGSGTTLSADFLKKLTGGSPCHRESETFNRLTFFQLLKVSGQVTFVTQCDALNYQDHA